MSVAAQESRVDFVVRLVGLLVLGFGAALLYVTYANANVAGQAPAIVPVYYLLGLLLLIVGFLAVFSKFK